MGRRRRMLVWRQRWWWLRRVRQRQQWKPPASVLHRGRSELEEYTKGIFVAAKKEFLRVIQMLFLKIQTCEVEGIVNGVSTSLKKELRQLISYGSVFATPNDNGETRVEIAEDWLFASTIKEVKIDCREEFWAT